MGETCSVEQEFEVVDDATPGAADPGAGLGALLKLLPYLEILSEFLKGLKLPGRVSFLVKAFGFKKRVIIEDAV